MSTEHHETGIAIFWHRRDFRIRDNAGLFKALQCGLPVLPLFIFDKNILEKLEDDDDARVSFLHREVEKLSEEYRQAGSSLRVEYGRPLEVWQRLIDELPINAVFTNRDYEPYAREREDLLTKLFNEKGIDFKGAKDHVIFEKNEVVKDDGLPYTVFTPYMNKWKRTLQPVHSQSYSSENLTGKLLPSKALPFPSLASMGFRSTKLEFPPCRIDSSVLDTYHAKRDIPSIRGTSRISLHLRFGTISIREALREAQQHSEKWLNELIWRDFYQMIMFHYPQSAQRAFKPAYDAIPWRNDPDEFTAWCEGRTGYPIVDAGMRELNTTGFMHNRVRMITASFLTKHLLIDWRWGERYFARKLLDFDLASNVGGWQWAASSGCDAAPYFRVFNPQSQQEKFDPNYLYIKTWVPEFGTELYPAPIVEHKFARERVLQKYKAALSE